MIREWGSKEIICLKYDDDEGGVAGGAREREISKMQEDQRWIDNPF